MNLKLQIAILLGVIAYFLILLKMLKNKKLNLKYALLWIVSGCVMLLIDLFPGLLAFFAESVGIIEPTNALFALLLFCGIIILMSMTAIVSKLNEQVKGLAQSVALLEKRIRELETK